MQKQADVNMTFESFVELYEKDVRPKLKGSTWCAKESIIRLKILPYFGKRHQQFPDTDAAPVEQLKSVVRHGRILDCRGEPHILRLRPELHLRRCEGGCEVYSDTRYSSQPAPTDTSGAVISLLSVIRTLSFLPFVVQPVRHLYLL